MLSFASLRPRFPAWYFARCLLMVLPVAGLHAALTLAPLFSDGAILQQGKPVPVWGQATPGERVTVQFGGQTVATLTDATGHWLVLLEPMAPTLTGTDLTATGETTLTRHDVLVGDVWLCAGAEDLATPVAQAAEADREQARPPNPLLRHFSVAPAQADTPADPAPASWQSAGPATVGGFSATGHAFARQLQPRLGIPLGLITVACAHSAIEAWLSPGTLASQPAFANLTPRWRQTLAAYPAAQARYAAELAAWQHEDAATKNLAWKHATFLRKHPRPTPPLGPDSPAQPAGLHQSMLQSVLPYAVRGVLWAQGTANAGHPDEYLRLFSTLIASWREHFGAAQLPFYFAQLPAWPLGHDSDGLALARLREAQAQALALPGTGMVVALDLGPGAHDGPRPLAELGRRFALLARAAAYHQPCDYSGPLFAGATREGPALRVRFTHADTGLIAHDRPVQSLQLAGADRRFHPAEGRLDGTTLVVTAHAVPDPVAVRYAWENAPGANLFNGSGLPAAPFRSDDW